jgi:hypothetical protein
MPSHQGQGQALCLQRFGDTLAQAVPEQRYQRLCPRIDAAALLPEGQRSAVAQKGAWRQLVQQRFGDGDVEAGIAACHGMADPVAFGRIEEQHLVGLGDGLVAAEMAHEDAAIRKHQMRGAGAFFGALMLAIALAAYIAHRDGRRLQQRLDGDLGHGLQVVFQRGFRPQA